MYFLFQDFCDTPNGQIYDIVNLVGIVVTIIQIAIPILLIILAMIDLGKMVVTSKDEDRKKVQGLMIKRIISAIAVFFLIGLVKMVVNLLNVNESSETGHSVNSCLKLISNPDFNNVIND